MNTTMTTEMAPAGQNSDLTATQFTTAEIQDARNYWSGLQDNDLYEFWQHYTTGSGRGMYGNVDENTSFLDYIVFSARQSAFERAHDC